MFYRVKVNAEMDIDVALSMNLLVAFAEDPDLSASCVSNVNAAQDAFSS